MPAEAARRLDAKGVAARDDLALVVDLGQPAAVDYVQFLYRHSERGVGFVSWIGAFAGIQGGVHCYPLGESSPLVLAVAPRQRIAALVVFLPAVLTPRERQVLNELFAVAPASQVPFVGLISSFRVHLGDQAAAESEAYAVAAAQKHATRVSVLRPGHIISAQSRTSRRLRHYAWLYPLVPRWVCGCFLGGEELFAVIESERTAAGRRGTRTYTLLGPCRSWRELLKEHHANRFFSACLTFVSSFLALLLVGHLVAIALALGARRRLFWRILRVGTLKPRSFRELLSLYNKYNHRYVKVVGYNNGVNHFGHRYPGKTIVSTVLCNRIVRAGRDLLKVDCGATVRQALDFLTPAGYELPVVPNFSYVCMGTSFFVPIHGSAADVSTIGETITRVTLYDPNSERMVRARRQEPAFQKYAYNQGAEVLLLRLVVRIKPKSRYFVHKEVVEDPDAQQLVEALQDPDATNVEIRQASASTSTVTISRYYKDPCDTRGAVLELPRDALGRLWDRLEENRATAFLMHALTRYFAWHVELYFNAAQFAVFWESHRPLPLRKLQVRYIRRDGLPCSPFRDHDCVSVDLFMLRRHRRRFEDYLRTTFGDVRTNPGKHSR